MSQLGNNRISIIRSMARRWLEDVRVSGHCPVCHRDEIIDAEFDDDEDEDGEAPEGPSRGDA